MRSCRARLRLHGHTCQSLLVVTNRLWEVPGCAVGSGRAEVGKSGVSSGWTPNPLVHRLYRQGPSKMSFTPTMAAMIKTSAPSASNTQRPPLLDARISSIVGSDCSGAESEVAPAISTDYRSTALQTAYASCKPDAYL